MYHHLEYPCFTLYKKPYMNIRTYTSTNGYYVQFEPSAYGLSNICDKDVIIFIVSQMMHKINRGDKLNQEVIFSAYDVLIATNKRTDGHDYKIL